MPIITFTADEVVEPIVLKMRELSRQIVELGELDPANGGKPLDPGESPDARRHKIARLGRQLAVLFLAFDNVMSSTRDRSADQAPDPSPNTTN